MIKEKNGSLLLSDIDKKTESINVVFEKIQQEFKSIHQDLKLTQAELKNRTGSVLRMEQKIDMLIRQLIEANVVKVK